LASASEQLHFMKNGIARTVPSSSKRPPRKPVTVQHLTALQDALDFSNTFDSAVWACATSAFYGVNRLGVFTPLSQSSYDPTKFAMRSDIEFGSNFFAINSPWSKTTGENVVLLVSQQLGECDPVAAMNHHLIINKALPPTAPLFAFQTTAGWTVLVKEWFMNRCNQIWREAGLDILGGHSFRIGGATELLARGVPPEIVAVQGHWRSDAFMAYWRRIQVILPQWTSSSPGSLSASSIQQRISDWQKRLRSRP
jgi:hypothetical protein